MSRYGADKYTPELCDKLAEMFADGSSITKVAATKLRVSRNTYYLWKENYPEFKEAAEHAENLAEAAMEDIAIAGVKGEIDKFSASMHQFMMRNQYRKTYGDDEKKDNDMAKTLLEQLIGGQVTLTKNDDK